VDEWKRRDDRCIDVKKSPMINDATDDCCNANHVAKPKRSLASRATTAQSCVHLHIFEIGYESMIRKRAAILTHHKRGTRLW
jgi:hypothetical protein